MKKIGVLFLLLGALLCCQQKRIEEKKKAKTEVIVRGEAQGTTYTVKYIAEEYNGVKEEMDSLLMLIDRSMSTYLPSSAISALNNGDTIQLDTHFQNVYQLSKKVNQETEGAFDPTIGPLIKAWGFDYSDPQKMDSSKVDSLLSSSGFENFVISENSMWKLNSEARINFNAIAQGYSVDVMASILDEKGVENYYVELGGELVVKGKNKFDEDWVIGIDKPSDENLERALTSTLKITNRALATSGNYRKYYEIDGKRYSHTLNPTSGYPVLNSLLSATVVAPTAAEADALATAFMVMGFSRAKEYVHQHQEIDCILITAATNDKMDVYISKGLESSL